MSRLNVNGLRQPWESDEHWELRKEFLDEYKKKFDEDKLLCLAQVYTNMELLCCSYPDEVMKQVRELATNLTHSKQLQEARKERASIQFVKEKEQNPREFPRRKGKRGATDDITTDSPKIIKFESKESLQSVKQEPHDNSCSSSNVTFSSANSTRNLLSSSQQIIPFNMSDERFKTLTSLGQLIRKFTVGGCSGIEAIHNAVQKLGLSIVYNSIMKKVDSDKNPHHCTTVQINNIIIAEGLATSKKSSRHESASKAVEMLTKPPYDIMSDNGELRLVTGQTSNDGPSTNIHMTGFVPEATKAPQVQNQTLPIKESIINYAACDSFRNFVVMVSFTEENPISTLMRALNFNQVKFQLDYNMEIVQNGQTAHSCSIVLNGQSFCKGFGSTKQEAKEEVSKTALQHLRQIGYTVKVKTDNAGGFEVSRSQVLGLSNDNTKSLEDDNIGCKMLKMMGWKGGGLGKEGKFGIEEPISAEEGYRGKGLGFSSGGNKEFKSRIRSLLQDYKKSSTTSDLLFSKEFSKEERKEVHEVASRFHLKSNSYGQGNDRHLVISKRFTPTDLLNLLMQSGGITHKYELVSPHANCNL